MKRTTFSKIINKESKKEALLQPTLLDLNDQGRHLCETCLLLNVTGLDETQLQAIVDAYNFVAGK